MPITKMPTFITKAPRYTQPRSSDATVAILASAVAVAG
jgi:hypothetical protein